MIKNFIPKLISKLVIIIFSFAFFTISIHAQENVEAKAETEIDNTNRKVYVGVYLDDISSFELTEGRFNADLDVWVKWLGSEEVPHIQFANGEIASQDEIMRESDGDWHSVRWSVQGTFRGTFPLHNFPFDRQNLNIQLDLPREEGFLVADLAGSGMSEEFSITGWLYEPFFKADTEQQKYYSDFGSIESEGQPFEANSVMFNLEMHRPIVTYVIKFLLPLFIIIIVALLAFSLPPTELEADLSLGVTALLACIAFHFSQADSLPDVSYLVTADKFFIVSYIVILFSIIETVISYTLAAKDEARAIRLDRMTLKIVSIVIILSFGSILTTALYRKPEIEIPDVMAREEIQSNRNEVTLSVLSLSSLNTSNILHGLVYRGLYYTTPEGNVPHLLVEIPDLTNDYVRFTQDGGAKVTWKLKPDLKWGDGSPITADDMIFSINVDEDSNRIAVNKVDEQTIEVEYAKRTNDIVKKFTLYPKAQFETVFAEKGEDGILDKLRVEPPAMDGPYILEEFKEKEFAKFRRNPYFAGSTPRIETVYVRVSGKDFVEGMKNKEANIAGFLSVQSFSKLSDVPHLKSRTDDYENLLYFQPNLKLAPYNDVNFRKALMYGINREGMMKAFALETSTATNSYRPSNEDDFNKNLIAYEYNPAKAKQLLANIKFDRPVKLILPEAILKSPDLPIILSMEKDMKALGIPTEIEYTSTTSSELVKEGTYDGMLYRTVSSSFNQPTTFWNLPYSESEEIVANDVFDESLVRLNSTFKSTMFEERRVAISLQMQEKWNEKLPVIPIGFPVYRSVYDSQLVGWEPQAVEGNIWWNVEDWYFVGEVIAE